MLIKFEAQICKQKVPKILLEEILFYRVFN
jgi:hypothetical protein